MAKAFTLIEVLVVAVIVSVLAAVAIPAYNYYIRHSKEEIALSYASSIASAAAAYYSQSQAVPVFNVLSIKAPVGFSGTISGDEAIVSPAGTPPGYAIGDFSPQSIKWKNN